MKKPSGYFVRWIGPWRLVDVDESMDNTQILWVRDYEEEAHCERCRAVLRVYIGPMPE